MKKYYSTSWFVVILFVFVLCSGVWCNEEITDVDGAPMEKTEKEALFSAIQGFVGNWWNGSDLYPDPCGWTPIQGVSCDIYNGLWYITVLNFGPVHENSLACSTTPEFRPQLFELNHLQSLSFFNCFNSPTNQPFTALNDNLSRLLNLESLEFRSNPGLISQLPSSIGNLTKLQSLVVLENGLTGRLPSSIGNLSRLKRLVLAGNVLSGKIPDSFGWLSELLILDLSRNTLSESLPLTFGGLTSLLKLDLSHNLLEGRIPESLGFLKNLTLLDLRNNRFSGGLSQNLQELESLTQLALSNNPIGGDLKSIEWWKLEKLMILDLSGIGLSGEIPDSLSKLRALRFLGVSNNSLTGNLSPKLASLPCLGAFYVNGNNLIGELGFSELFYAKMGRRFGAWGNPNLCYTLGLVSSNHVPFGVKPCLKKEVVLVRTQTDNKLEEFGSTSMSASLGFSSYFRIGFLSMVWMEMLMTVFLLNC